MPHAMSHARLPAAPPRAPHCRATPRPAVDAIHGAGRASQSPAQRHHARLRMCNACCTSSPDAAQPASLGQPPPAGAAAAAASASGSARDPLEAAHFQEMTARLQRWQQLYYTTVVPCSTHDAQGLGEWAAAVRRLRRRGLLPPAQAAALDALGMVWDVNGMTAKWHANFHAAREFREAHGGAGCDVGAALPPDFRHAARADWVEAARWLGRQRELYEGQRLHALRLRLLKEVLGVRLARQRGPPRRNLHPALRAHAAAFGAERARREAEAEAEGEEPGAAEGEGAGVAVKEASCGSAGDAGAGAHAHQTVISE